MSTGSDADRKYSYEEYLERYCKPRSTPEPVHSLEELAKEYADQVLDNFFDALKSAGLRLTIQSSADD